MASKRRQPGKRPPADPVPRTGKATRARRAKAPAAAKPRQRREEEDGAREPEVAEAAPEPSEEGDGPEPIAAEPEVLPPEPAEEGTTLPVPVERDLSHADALQRYMADVSRHPLLTREEEHELAVKFRETQDPRIAYRLVTANLRLVVKIAHEYRRAAFSLLDLIQEGNVGLMQAVQKYDPFRGVKLSSYAAWWIRAYILRYLMDNWRMVKLGTTQAQRKLFFNLRKE